jgi:hypothetical protein
LVLQTEQETSQAKDPGSLNQETASASRCHGSDSSRRCSGSFYRAGTDDYGCAGDGERQTDARARWIAAACAAAFECGESGSRRVARERGG